MTEKCDIHRTCSTEAKKYAAHGHGKCSTQSATSDCGECCDMPGKLLAMADEAWYELLKEKIKKEIQGSCGERLDKLAKLVAETNNAKWAHEIMGKVKCEEYKGSLHAMFTEECTK